MSGILQNLRKGGAEDSSAEAKSQDSDFADFAPPEQAVGGSPIPPTPESATVGGGGVGVVPYTKWYRVWERTSPKDFAQEAFIVPFIFIIIIFHFWGTSKNRRKAKAWAQNHVPVLQSEFAVVGYSGIAHKADPTEKVEVDETLLKEKAINEFSTYATGRQNVAFMDVSIKLLKRYNPLLIFADSILALFFDSMTPSVEKVEVIAYPFDGKEKDVVPPSLDQPEQRSKSTNSSYDSFVFAIVHKNAMRQLRLDRYDVSLTSTKDNAKLPSWLTVMSENAEITDLILTPDMIKVVEEAGDLLEYLIITDQPEEKPVKIEDYTPQKRTILSLKIPSSDSASESAPSAALLKSFIRLTDRLASAAHFRPEITRKIRNTREEEMKKIKRIDEEEKAEERKIAAEKVKKDARDRLLRGMSAEEQRKYLEKEKDREQKRGMKKGTKRA